jgi:hypothetical protein
MPIQQAAARWHIQAPPKGEDLRDHVRGCRSPEFIA